MRRRLPALALAASSLLTAPVAAQSLADVAEKEQKRREGIPIPTASPPVYTDQDLKDAREKRLGPEPSPSPSPSPAKGGAARPSPSPRPGSAARTSPSPAVSPTPPVAPEPDRAALEARWRTRARQAREAVTMAESRIAELEQRIAALREDRGVSGVNDPFREQTRQSQLAQASQQLEEARTALVRARQALVDLEDEARRAGALPGWLREP